ncbi:hypothetical protein [Demequina aurantiaca]|uniref:hypothetical protein n=1 Tax=Demequina aurantiaca TaxID=676200 RepID=UPI000782ECF8|nr:hypothetical protein [Demequina aurantiaca]
MGWSLSASVARLAHSVGMRGRWRSPYSVSHAAGVAQRGSRATGDTVYARVYDARMTASSPADRKALAACRDQVVLDGAVIERAAASGAPLAAIAALAEGWDRLPEATRDLVRNPLGRTTPGPVTWGDTTAKQVDQTTCGAAVIAMELMMTDPFVALWVTSGRLLGGYVPAEIAAIEDFGRGLRSTERRWRALQRSLHLATSRRAVVGLPWPRAWGTAPWRVDNVTRVAGLRFATALLDDSRVDDVAAMVAHASAALRESIPVPMYTGGDSRMGVAAMVPRHVVLLTSVTDHVFLIYEPSSGQLRELPAALWLEDGTVRPALGHWSRICCLVLPVPRKRN